jgi:hypothetical protein
MEGASSLAQKGRVRVMVRVRVILGTIDTFKTKVKEEEVFATFVDPYPTPN